MNILIVVASRHCGTAEIGEDIAEVLQGSGISAEVVDASASPDPTGYDAVIIGSGVYFGRWLPDARRYLKTYGAALLAVPVWTFSSGPVDRPHAASAAAPTPDFLLAVSPIEHVTFGGRIDPRSLNRFESIVAALVRAGAVDYRDRAQVTRWATTIASKLTATVGRGGAAGQSR
jgi:menaquinone-dependent protoporphyrinogen oxidase